MAAKIKSRFIINVEYFLILVPILMVRALPLRAAYFLSTRLSMFFYYLGLRHGKRALQHVLHSGIVASREEAVALVKKNFLHFGKIAVEVIKSHQIVNEKNSRDFIKLNVGDEFEATCFIPETKKPVIIVTGHLGNWELAGNAYSWLSGFRLTSIMRDLGNPRLGDVIYANREGSTHNSISKSKGIKPLLMALKKGESIAIVADQHASTSEGIDIEFFGHPARAHSTPALLHLKTGVPIIIGALLRTDDSFHFEFKGTEVIRYTPTGDKEKDIRAVTQMYSSALEKLIRENPEQWMWAHRRWLDINRNRKKKKKEGTYNGKESVDQSQDR